MAGRCWIFGLRGSRDRIFFCFTIYTSCGRRRLVSGDIGRYPSIQCFPFRTEPGVASPLMIVGIASDRFVYRQLPSVPIENLSSKGLSTKPLTSEDAVIHIGIGM